MKKEDFIDLLKVIDSVGVLEEDCVILLGKVFEEGVGTALYSLWDVLRRNSSEKYRESEDFDTDIESNAAFVRL